MTSPIRVLHAHSGNLFGGIESMLVTFARYQHPALEHTFALSFSGRLEGALREANASVHLVGPARFSRPWSIRAARRHLGSALREARPTIVLTHSPWSHAVAAPVARAAGIPLVHWQHGPSTGRHWLERLARRHPPDSVICNSRYTSESSPPLFAGAPHTVVHPPSPLPAAPPVPAARARLREALGVQPEASLILQVSRLEPWKGHRTLLDAIGPLRARGDWAFVHVGGAHRDSERRYLRGLTRRAADLGIADRVRFLGERTDVPDLLAVADVFCQPNTGPEPFGLAFVEALYAGLPVVASSTGGTLEIVNEECGVLVPAADDRALGNALRRLLDDPALRRRLGAAGPNRARALCDPWRQADRLADALRALATPR